MCCGTGPVYHSAQLSSMSKLLALSKALPVLAAGALAVDYPTIPQDLTTPYQQRLAIYGPNGKTSSPILALSN